MTDNFLEELENLFGEQTTQFSGQPQHPYMKQVKGFKAGMDGLSGAVGSFLNQERGHSR